MKFEEHDNRFPLLVSHVKGYKGPRCDILSFLTVRERVDFINQGASPIIGSVNRFIEVKGRANESTPISLAGNELNAAEAYGERYFLYRLFDKGDDEYVLLILKNPLSHPEAVTPVKDVRFSRANDVARYDLTFGPPSDGQS